MYINMNLSNIGKGGKQDTEHSIAFQQTRVFSSIVLNKPLTSRDSAPKSINWVSQKANTPRHN